MATQLMKTNFLSSAWESVKKANAVLKPSDRGYALSWATWGAGLSFDQEPMVAAGLVGALATTLLKKRFAQHAEAKKLESLPDKLIAMDPEVAREYLDYLSEKEEMGGFRRTLSSGWSKLKFGAIAAGALYVTFNTPNSSTDGQLPPSVDITGVETTCQRYDEATQQTTMSPC